MKKIALELFGQYRSYKLNFEYNLKQLLPYLKEYTIDIFIFSENYDENKENDIINIINSFKSEYSLNIKMIKYFEYVDDIYKKTSKLNQEKFNLSIDTIYDKSYRLNHLKGYNEFTIEYIYRKYLLHKLSKEYFEYEYDFIINARLFDISFNIMKPLDFLNNINNTLYHSIDTFYIAKEHIMNNFLLKCVEYKIKDMNQPEFRNVLKKYDYNLNGCFPFLCSELITLKIIFDNFKDSMNLRYNFTMVEVNKEPMEKWINYLDIRLCNYRHRNINKIINIKNLMKAVYGNNNTFIDVTDIINQNTNKIIEVGNKIFNNDPLKNMVKKLVLEFNNSKIIVNENENIYISI